MMVESISEYLRTIIKLDSDALYDYVSMMKLTSEKSEAYKHPSMRC